MGPLDDDAEARFRAITFAYREVLDATKHQDDKIGRFLAAAAFLIAGVLAFGGDRSALDVRLVFRGGDALALPVILFAGFMISVTLAVLQWVLAMSTPILDVPRSRLQPTPDAESSDPGQVGSRIFFRYIDEAGDEPWEREWYVDPLQTPVGDVERVRDRLFRDLVLETRKLAARTSRKYRQSRTASTFLLMALVFFALDVVVLVSVPAGVSRVPFDAGQRLAMAAVLVPVPAIWQLHGLSRARYADERMALRLRGCALPLSAIALVMVPVSLKSSWLVLLPGLPAMLIFAFAGVHDIRAAKKADSRAEARGRAVKTVPGRWLVAQAGTGVAIAGVAAHGMEYQSGAIVAALVIALSPAFPQLATSVVAGLSGEVKPEEP